MYFLTKLAGVLQRLRGGRRAGRGSTTLECTARTEGCLAIILCSDGCDASPVPWPRVMVTDPKPGGTVAESSRAQHCFRLCGQGHTWESLPHADLPSQDSLLDRGLYHGFRISYLDPKLLQSHFCLCTDAKLLLLSVEYL